MEVTATGTGPAAWAGVTTSTDVSVLVRGTIEAGTPPKVTDVVSVRPLVAVMVTTVPPVVGPAVGVKLRPLGAGTKVNCWVETTEPPGSATVTKYGPAAWAGVTAVMVVGFTTTTLVAN